MPPEAFQRSKPGKSSDIWSFGITILEVLTGKHDTLATTPTEHLLYLPLAIAFKFKLFAMYFSTLVFLLLQHHSIMGWDFIWLLGCRAWKGWSKVGSIRVPAGVAKQEKPANLALLKDPVRALVSEMLSYDKTTRPCIEEVTMRLQIIEWTVIYFLTTVRHSCDF